MNDDERLEKILARRLRQQDRVIAEQNALDLEQQREWILIQAKLREQDREIMRQDVEIAQLKHREALQNIRIGFLMTEKVLQDEAIARGNARRLAEARANSAKLKEQTVSSAKSKKIARMGGL